jgi:LysR family glycine cleavage system transcriptional activator
MERPRRELPLHVLPAFEAAARHGSFRAAAQELHLTPSAISHQIKLLEDALGLNLFRRLPRGLALTAAGREYRTTVGEVLERLQHDADALSGAATGTKLRISMPDCIAMNYFLPGLHHFRANNPEFELEISVGAELADVEGGAVDAAIRMGRGRWDKLCSYKLADICGTPVAAPELAAHALELSTRGELPVVYLPVIENCTRRTLAAIGLTTSLERGMAVNSQLFLIQAVEEGLGVAVMVHPSWDRVSPRPRLMLLTEEPLPLPFGMYLVCRETEARHRRMIALRDWAESVGAGGTVRVGDTKALLAGGREVNE